jgi:hypothetical protein
LCTKLFFFVKSLTTTKWTKMKRKERFPIL